MHVPNRAGGRKYPFLDAVLACARRWRRGPALLLGDTNSGRRGLDEQVAAFNAREEGWIDALAACGWQDGFRHLQADARAYTWYSPNGRNGFRIDQAFVNAALLSRLAAAAYAWGGAARRRRRDLLSDHAALILDISTGGRPRDGRGRCRGPRDRWPRTAAAPPGSGGESGSPKAPGAGSAPRR